MTGFRVAGVDEDPVDPGFEAIDLAELRKLSPGRDEGLLHGVLGPPDVTQDPMRDGEEPISRVTGDRGECLFVPGPCRFDERPVHPFAPSFARPLRDASPSMSGARGKWFDNRSIRQGRGRAGRWAEAAADLASALGTTPGLVDCKRGESATGSAFRTVAGDDLDRVGLIVDQRPDVIRLEGGAIAGHLASRSGPLDASI